MDQEVVVVKSKFLTTILCKDRVKALKSALVQASRQSPVIDQNDSIISKHEAGYIEIIKMSKAKSNQIHFFFFPFSVSWFCIFLSKS